MPLISEVIDIDPNFLPLLKNCYIGDQEGIYTNSILLEFDFSFKIPECTSYEHRIKNNIYFKKLIDLEDEVLYIFNFPEEYLNEYLYFKDGKYSKFGEDAKELILEFWYKFYKDNKQAIPFLVKIKQILFRDEKLRRKLEKELDEKLDEDAELSSIPDLEKELFKFKN